MVPFAKILNWKHFNNKPRENVKGLVAPHEVHTCSLGLAWISFAWKNVLWLPMQRLLPPYLLFFIYLSSIK